MSTSSRFSLLLMTSALLAVPTPAASVDDVPQRHTVHWPGFRGADGDGIGDGLEVPVSWDLGSGANVRFAVPLPGLGTSSPVIWGERVFVTTAIAHGIEQGIRIGNTGSGETIEEKVEHGWHVEMSSR